jgi:hypothetical protein
MRTFSQTKGKDDQSKPKPKSEKAAEDPEPEEPANEAAAPEVLVSRLAEIHNKSARSVRADSPIVRVRAASQRGWKVRATRQPGFCR